MYGQWKHNRDFHNTLAKMDRGIGNITQKLHRCYSTFSPEKLIENNRLDNLQGRENSVSSEFIHYDRFSCTRSRIDRVTTDRKITRKSILSHITIFFSEYYNTICIATVLTKIKISKDLWNFNNSLSGKSNFSTCTKILIAQLKKLEK